MHFFGHNAYDFHQIPDTILHTSPILAHLIVVRTLGGRYYYYPHSIDEETKTQRG